MGSTEIGVAAYYYGKDYYTGEGLKAEVSVCLYRINAWLAFEEILSAEDTNGMNPDYFKEQLNNQNMNGNWYDECAYALQGMNLYENPWQEQSMVPNPLKDGLGIPEQAEDLVILDGVMPAGTDQMRLTIKDYTTFAK